jgi:uncharacterized lipoprotein YbaY
MMRGIIMLIIIMFVMMLAGCATQQPEPPPPEEVKLTVAVSVPARWVEMVADIATEDEVLGLFDFDDDDDD